MRRYYASNGGRYGQLHTIQHTGVLIVVLVACSFGDSAEQDCKTAVEAQLVAPATAEYISIEEHNTEEWGREFRIEVDSENRLSVPLRSRFRCRVAEDGCVRILTDEDIMEEIIEGLD